MDNFLNNGGVLPHGLLGGGQGDMEGFNKTYRNTSMRLGVIVAIYPISDDNNKTKFTTEYDVVAIEQNEDKGITSTLYRNCMSASSFGAIADYFEANLRARKSKKYKGDANRLSDQNGATVLLLCLDGASEKAIIIGGFPHPDRTSTLKDDQPHLEAEYNGVNIKVNSDGSTSFVFKGATDNDGKIIDASQGPTTVKVDKDGSYQVDHKTITQRFDKNGKASLTADGNISNTTKKNFSVTATENVNITSTKDTSMKMTKLIMQASGSAVIEGEAISMKASSEFKVEAQEFKVEAATMAKIKAANITLDGLVSLGGEGGQPLLMLSAMIMGTGNLGIPVISNAISGFTTKVMGQ